jgi:hypothetical protein
MTQTRERMLRELAAAVEMLALERPLVFVLEDLQREPNRKDDRCSGQKISISHAGLPSCPSAATSRADREVGGEEPRLRVVLPGHRRLDRTKVR